MRLRSQELCSKSCESCLHQTHLRFCLNPALPFYIPFLTKIDPSCIPLTSLSGPPRVDFFEACGVFLEIESILFSTNIDHKGLQRIVDEYAAESRIY